MTTIRSASTMVESRCAMTSAVRLHSRFVERGLDQGLARGVERTGGLVENHKGGALQRARAIASRCRSPWLSLNPPSPTRVS